MLNFEVLLLLFVDHFTPSPSLEGYLAATAMVVAVQ